jgi:hypothetical protein
MKKKKTTNDPKKLPNHQTEINSNDSEFNKLKKNNIYNSNKFEIN